jgi:quercetin dioxygenase-like cupin family protein
MRLGAVLATVVFVLLLTGSGPGAAQAQQDGAPKGVSAKNLVTSLGGFTGSASVPISVTGRIVTIEPGGQTGRERYLVPAYVYVLEGTLTTNSEGGPVGVAGAQYHGAGQSYMDVPGVWHNYSNPGQTALKYLILFIGTPGARTLEQPTAD